MQGHEVLKIAFPDHRPPRADVRQLSLEHVTMGRQQPHGVIPVSRQALRQRESGQLRPGCFRGFTFHTALFRLRQLRFHVCEKFIPAHAVPLCLPLRQSPEAATAWHQYITTGAEKYDARGLVHLHPCLTPGTSA